MDLVGWNSIILILSSIDKGWIHDLFFPAFIPCIILTFIYMIVLVNNDNPGATSFQMDLLPNLAVLYRQNINLSSNSCGYFYLN